jgi:hypothetical protein
LGKLNRRSLGLKKEQESGGRDDGKSQQVSGEARTTVLFRRVDRGGRSGRSFEEGAKRGDKEETVGSSGREKESTKGWKVEMKCVIGSKAYFVSKP